MLNGLESWYCSQSTVPTMYVNMFGDPWNILGAVAVAFFYCLSSAIALFACYEYYTSHAACF